MPYGGCYRVINAHTGQIHARCTSLEKATRQVRLLHAIDHGFVPKNRKSKKTK